MRHINDIIDNYRTLEQELVAKLSYTVKHYVTAGTNREYVWEEFFRNIVPKKFNIARSVFVIDSYGNCSNEVDIAIYDEQFTPYIFNYKSIKFIPIEAVAAVIQCKSYSFKTQELKVWCESIRKLKTSSDSIARLATHIHIGSLEDVVPKPTQISTTPIVILCYIREDRSKKIRKGVRESFDIVLESFRSATPESGNLNIFFSEDNHNLYQILCRYNRSGEKARKISSEKIKAVKDQLSDRKIQDLLVESKDEQYTLLSFIFQFNQMLMMINNPLFFPHQAYVNLFNRCAQGREGDNNE